MSQKLLPGKQFVLTAWRAKNNTPAAIPNEGIAGRPHKKFFRGYNSRPSSQNQQDDNGAELGNSFGNPASIANDIEGRPHTKKFRGYNSGSNDRDQPGDRGRELSLSDSFGQCCQIPGTCLLTRGHCERRDLWLDEETRCLQRYHGFSSHGHDFDIDR